MLPWETDTPLYHLQGQAKLKNVVPYSGKIWRALNLAKWGKKGCILILAIFKFGGLELYL